MNKLTSGEILVAALFEEAERVGGYKRQNVVVRRRKIREGEGKGGGGEEEDGIKTIEESFEPLGIDEVEYPTLHEEEEFNQDFITDAEKEQLDKLDQTTLTNLVCIFQKQINDIRRFLTPNPINEIKDMSDDARTALNLIKPGLGDRRAEKIEKHVTAAFVAYERKKQRNEGMKADQGGENESTSEEWKERKRR